MGLAVGGAEYDAGEGVSSESGLYGFTFTLLADMANDTLVAN